MTINWRFLPNSPARAAPCRFLLCAADLPATTLADPGEAGPGDARRTARSISSFRAARPAPGAACSQPAQQAALARYRGHARWRRGFSACLLHGVTGSGKTAVYLAAMSSAPRSAAICHPAGARDRPDARHGRAACMPRLAEVALLHSALTPGRARRAVASHPARRSADCGGHPVRRLRSVDNLGLIIVDEEHDSSLQAGRDSALPRPRCRRHASQDSTTLRRSRLRDAFARVLAQCGERASTR